MRTTPNLDLTVWNDNSDEFNPTELADNWDKIDAASDTTAEVEVVATVPATDLFVGRVVYLSAADSGFAAKRLLAYNGTVWKDLGTPEEFASLPTVGNYHGRIVMLTSAGGGFAADSMVVNTDGANAWKQVGGVQFGATLPAAPTAGQVFLLTGSDGGFTAYTLLAYNGSAWIRLEQRGVEVGDALPGSPYKGELFVLTAADGGFKDLDLVQYTGSTWRLLTGPQYITLAEFIVLTGIPSGYEVYLRIDDSDGVLWHLRYNSISSSPYKWEAIGANSLIQEVETDESPSVARAWTDLTTEGPAWTVPTGLAGDFQFSAQATQTPNTKVGWKIGVSVNDVDPTKKMISHHHGQDTDKHTLVFNTRKITDLTEGDEVKLKYWVKKVEPQIGDRLLLISPVRIGIV